MGSRREFITLTFQAELDEESQAAWRTLLHMPAMSDTPPSFELANLLQAKTRLDSKYTTLAKETKNIVDQAAKATSLSDVVPFLEYVCGSGWEVVLDQLHETVAGDIACTPTRALDPPRPQISFHYAHETAQVYPTEIRRDGAPLLGPGRGRAFLSSLDPVLNYDYLRWQRVTHIVNCMGKFKQRQICDTHKAAVKSHFDGITYLNWVYALHACYATRRSFYDTVRTWLEDPHNTVVFHCKSGRDRSPFTVVLFLMDALELPRKTAIDLVQQHRDAHGRPIPRVLKNHSLHLLDDVESEVRQRVASRWS